MAARSESTTTSDLTAPDYSYAGLPEEYFSFPGQVITTMDGDDVSDRFECGCRKSMPPGDIRESRRRRGRAAGGGSGPGR